MLKPSTTPPTPESAKRPAPPKGGKGAVAAAPVPVEVSHVVLLTDDIISRLPLEPFVFESFGITSVSRDFCKSIFGCAQKLQPDALEALQTFLERYRSNVPVPAVNADPKKKPNAAPENDSSAMVFSGISCE